MSKFHVYWIQSQSRNMAYIGATIDPKRRLRQHNSEIQGGSTRTRARGPWYFQCVVNGFRTWKECLQYEFMLKVHIKRCPSVQSKVSAIGRLNSKERWSVNAPLASEVPLVVKFKPSEYGYPPAQYWEICNRAVVPKRNSQRKSDWKKNLCGVKY